MIQILDKMIQEGRAPRVKLYAKGSNEDPGHIEETFQPRIVSRSSKVKVNGTTNVYDRLYNHGKKMKKEKNEKIINDLEQKFSCKAIKRKHQNFIMYVSMYIILVII